MIPLWFLLASVSAVGFALEGVWVKYLWTKRGFTPEFLAWCVATFVTPVLLTVLLWRGIPEIKPAFYFPFVMTVVLNTAGLLCYFRALTYGDLSLVFPLLSLTPAWMLFSTKHITGEFPLAPGLAGISLITLGCYALGLKGRNLLAPFRNIWNSPGARWALACSVIWSFTANFDKAAVEASSPMFHPAMHGIALSASLYLVSARRCKEDFRRLATKAGFWSIMVLTLIVSVLVVAQFFALDLAQATYITAVKRSGMVLGVLLGWLVYKEPYGARRFLLSLVVLGGLLLMMFA